MKRISLISFLFVITLCLKGQEFRLIELKESNNDSLISANTCYDINGNISAILILSFSEPISGLSYRGNVLKSSSLNDSTYILHIASSTKRLSIYHDDFYPFLIDFKENGIIVKGGHSYMTEINNITEDEEQQLEGAQYLVFKSDVPLKMLTVNGENWKIVDNKSSKLVPMGKYTYIAESEDGRRVNGLAEVKSKLSNKMIKLKF